jgi:hypothetical protein
MSRMRASSCHGFEPTVVTSRCGGVTWLGHTGTHWQIIESITSGGFLGSGTHWQIIETTDSIIESVESITETSGGFLGSVST